jgi:hypothetical protein
MKYERRGHDKVFVYTHDPVFVGSVDQLLDNDYSVHDKAFINRVPLRIVSDDDNEDMIEGKVKIPHYVKSLLDLKEKGLNYEGALFLGQSTFQSKDAIEKRNKARRSSSVGIDENKAGDPEENDDDTDATLKQASDEEDILAVGHEPEPIADGDGEAKGGDDGSDEEDFTAQIARARAEAQQPVSQATYQSNAETSRTKKADPPEKKTKKKSTNRRKASPLDPESGSSTSSSAENVVVKTPTGRLINNGYQLPPKSSNEAQYFDMGDDEVPDSEYKNMDLVIDESDDSDEKYEAKAGSKSVSHNRAIERTSLASEIGYSSSVSDMTIPDRGKIARNILKNRRIQVAHIDEEGEEDSSIGGSKSRSNRPVMNNGYFSDANSSITSVDGKRSYISDGHSLTGGGESLTFSRGGKAGWASDAQGPGHEKRPSEFAAWQGGRDDDDNEDMSLLELDDDDEDDNKSQISRHTAKTSMTGEIEDLDDDDAYGAPLSSSDDDKANEARVVRNNKW